MKIFALLFLPLFALLGALEGYQLLTESTAVTSSAAKFFFQNNFHEVLPGRLYRSAQMSREDLTQYVKKYGLKTVIDLRLGGPEDDHEDRTLSELGVKYIHAPLRGSRVPSNYELVPLLEAVAEAETPALIHCSSGTHRSAFASAIWLLTRERKSFAEAEDQFTARYGFFQIERDLKGLVQGHPTIDGLLWEYKEVNDREPVDFVDWLKSRR